MIKKKLRILFPPHPKGWGFHKIKYMKWEKKSLYKKPFGLAKNEKIEENLHRFYNFHNNM